MKKIFLSIITASLVFLTSCVNESEDFNNDRDKPYALPPALHLSYAQKELASQMATPNVNLNVFRFFQHYWTATTYNTDAQFDFARRRVPDNHWRILYTEVLKNLKSAEEGLPLEIKPSTITQAEWDKQQTNKAAIIDILQVYTFHILVDCFGDVPYSESLNPFLVLPKYDDANTIYIDLLNRLDKDLAKLDNSYSAGSFESADLYLKGDIAKWIKFANSLKLKIGINLADVNPGLAKSTIESAYNGGVIKENLDDVKFNFLLSSPNYNPIYEDLIASGRSDFVAEETIVNSMNSLNDPRRDSYFNLYEESPGVFIYKGGILGIRNSYSKYSHIGTKFTKANLPAYLFDSSEINFYLAEAAARGYSVGNTAEAYYNAAITESFLQWGLTAADAATYLADPAVAFSSGNWKKSIGEQAWIAMFNRGFESWNFWKRLDYPLLTATNAASAAEGKVPVRLTYPISERTVNGASYTQAANAIGGDILTNKLFWDIN